MADQPQTPPTTPPAGDPPAPTPPAAATPPAATPPAPAVTPPAPTTPPAATPPATTDLPADWAARPEVVAEMRRREKEAGDAARTQAEADRVEAERRSKMEESERLRLEKKESDDKAAKETADRIAAEAKTEVLSVLLTSDRRFADPTKAAATQTFIQFQVAEAMKEKPGQTVADAVAKVMTEHAYLFAQIPPVPPTASAPATAPAGTPPATPPATTTPPEVPVTNMPPVMGNPEPGADALKMSPADFAAYKQRVYGVHG